MTSVINFWDQQYGYECWRSYGASLTRLQCPAPIPLMSNDVFESPSRPADILPPSDNPIFACKFARMPAYRNVIATADEDGKLTVQQLTVDGSIVGAEPPLSLHFSAHHNAIFDVAWQTNGMHLATASGDHTSRLFDVSNGSVRLVHELKGHIRSVKTVAFHTDDCQMLATGGRDGVIILWDVRCQNGVLTIPHLRVQIQRSHNLIMSTTTPTRSSGVAVASPSSSASTVVRANQKRCNSPAHKSGQAGSLVKSVTGLVFLDERSLISCGGGDGLIKVWDLRRPTGTAKCQIQFAGATTRNGFSNIVVDEQRTRLFANCLNGNIYCYNLHNLCDTSQPIMTYAGHQNNTFYIKSCLSRDGRYIISGSSDENAYIWARDSAQPIFRLTGHSAEVTCVAWSHHSDDSDPLIVTCSDDTSHRIWRMQPIREGNNHHQQAECLTRAHQRCTLKRRLHRACALHQNELRNNTKYNTNNTVSTTALKCLENMPNFAHDGLTPHFIFSPPKRRVPDWLSRMRIERQLRRRMEDLACTDRDSTDGAPVAKIARLDALGRQRQQRPQSPKAVSKTTTLLKFFKVSSATSGSLTNGSIGIAKYTTANSGGFRTPSTALGASASANR